MASSSLLSLILSLLLIPTGVVAIGDWSSNWDSPFRSLESAFQVDPNDSRCTMRGSGQIDLGAGVANMTGSPRLYISTSEEGWENVEMTAYGRFVIDGTFKSDSGLTMIARSNHDLYKDDGCEAFGYLARIYKSTGECAFQKEYYHGLGTVYTNSDRVDCFPGGLPSNQWVGMKLKVTTVPDTNGSVSLEMFLDMQNNGNWTLKHSFIDVPGEWTSSKTVPSQCPQSNGDTVPGHRNVCFLRSDSQDGNTVLQWRNATITNELISTPTTSTMPTTTTSTSTTISISTTTTTTTTPEPTTTTSTTTSTSTTTPEPTTTTSTTTSTSTTTPEPTTTTSTTTSTSTTTPEPTTTTSTTTSTSTTTPEPTTTTTTTTSTSTTTPEPMTTTSTGSTTNPPMWNNITFDDFDNGWGKWTKTSGSNDAKRQTNTSSVEAPYIPQGSACLRIRHSDEDDPANPSSVYLETPVDVSKFTKLKVDFSFCSRRVDNGEGFELEYTWNNGGNWTRITRFEHGTANDTDTIHYFANVNNLQGPNRISVEWNSTSPNIFHTTQAKIRFRSKLDKNNEQIYIDEVWFQGYGNA